MDVEECIEAYVKMSEAIFSKSKTKRKQWDLVRRFIDKLKTAGKYNTAEFEKVIKSVIQSSRLGNAEASFLQEDEKSGCKV